MFFDSKIKIIDIIQNEQGKMWIYEASGERCLSFKDPRLCISSRQSCILTQDIRKIVFEYQKMMLAALYVNIEPKKILMIGLGGGTLASALLDLLLDAKLDIVEINPDMLYVAEKYFFFKRSERTNLIFIDGREFIKQKSEQLEQLNLQGYDLIIIDAFDGDYIPEHFLQTQFVKKLQKIMNKNAVLAVNTFSSSSNYNMETELYSSIFGKFWSLKSNNRVILVTKEHMVDFETISRMAEYWKEKFADLGIDSTSLLSKFIIEG